jgi:tubulin polyglutamylase TTLL2
MYVLVYLQEGIARFATRKYDLSDLEDTFSHLTNTSLNKQSPTYYKHKDIVGLGKHWVKKKY